jgi:cysteine desulfurase/selenocysteine lyase
LKPLLEYIAFTERKHYRPRDMLLGKYAAEQLSEIELRIIGQAKEKITRCKFLLWTIHHQDIGVLLDNQGVGPPSEQTSLQPLTTTRFRHHRRNIIRAICCL